MGARQSPTQGVSRGVSRRGRMADGGSGEGDDGDCGDYGDDGWVGMMMMVGEAGRAF